LLGFLTTIFVFLLAATALRVLIFMPIPRFQQFLLALPTQQERKTNHRAFITHHYLFIFSGSAAQRLLVHEVSLSHKTTRHSR
jgi:hypothetical protein